MKVISSFVAGIFGIIFAIVSFIGFAISKGVFVEQLERLPQDPTLYFIVLAILGLVLAIISFTSQRYG